MGKSSHSFNGGFDGDGHQYILSEADKSQASRQWHNSLMTGLQDIDDMHESDVHIVASFEQILVPVVRVDRIEVMAIHSWEGFRRQWVRMRQA